MSNEANTGITAIQAFLDLVPTKTTTEPAPVVANTEPVTHVQDDYEFARESLRDLIRTGTKVFKEAADIAEAGQDADHFEVAGTLLNGLVSANKELLNLSGVHQKVTGASTKGPEKVTNNLFVGSTEELLKIMKEKKKP